LRTVSGIGAEKAGISRAIGRKVGSPRYGYALGATLSAAHANDQNLHLAAAAAEDFARLGPREKAIKVQEDGRRTPAIPRLFRMVVFRWAA